ncbi:MAG: hypothetical protein KC518_09385 [Candidatus Cloacimonetes bacterium]|nr:hypothetical protein [Candidatus Cloacimonadota bacterium]
MHSLFRSIHRPLPYALTMLLSAGLVGCVHRSSTTEPSVDAVLSKPLYQQELEHDNWKVRVEVPAGDDVASGHWQLTVWHAFLMVTPWQQLAPRPGMALQCWLDEMDGDPEPELAIWSGPVSRQTPGVLQLWDLQSGKLYPRPVPPFPRIPEAAVAATESLAWDGEAFVRTAVSPAGTQRFRWSLKAADWEAIPHSKN